MKTAQRVAFATCIATIILVGVGVWVRATGSGLGCPDWPLCHGGVVPPGDQGHEPIIEMTHRIVAGIVGLLIIATAAFAYRFYRDQPVILWAAIINVPLVGFQGLLGAITVWYELPPEIVATHLLTAMLILSLLAITAVGMYVADPSNPRILERGPQLKRTGNIAVAALAFFAVLLWVGGYMSESGASTACEGWPLCNGGVIPAADDHEIVHMLHRYLAGGLIFFIVPLFLRLWRRRNEASIAGTLAVSIVVLYAAQVLVGALNVWYTFPEPLTISHTVLASLIWFSISLVAAIALFEPVRTSRAARTAEVPA